MKRFQLPVLHTIIFLLLVACNLGFAQVPSQVKLDTVQWTDKTRNRTVPVALFTPQTKGKAVKQRLVVVSHGYGQNQGGDYLRYSYLTNFLASRGFFVASIQHELPTDSLIPSSGIPQIVRRPFWERGADNILFVINKLKSTHPNLDFQHITLIGHSNGGDMTALFAEKHPEIAEKIITLDNRRMPLPRTSKPRVYSLRSSDQPADEGVLPTNADQQKFGITVIKLSDTPHNDMGDSGTDAQKKEITAHVQRFIEEQ